MCATWRPVALPALLALAVTPAARGRPALASPAGRNGSRVFNVVDYGAVGDNSTDNTAAFSACMADVVQGGGGQMYIPHGVYRGRVVVPDVGATLPGSRWIAIEIVGETPPVPGFGTVGSFPNIGGGTVVTSDDAAGAAVISVSQSKAGYAGFNMVYVVVRNLEVKTYDNPLIGGVDLEFAVQCTLDRVFVNTGVYNNVASKPTHPGAVGLVTPAVNNGALTTLRNVWVTGYYSCIDVNEHTDGEAIVLGSCINGLNLLTAYHASRFARVEAFHNVNNVNVAGRHPFSIGQLDIEHTGPGQNTTWQNTAADINDPGNESVGNVRWWVVEGDVGWSNEFTVVGGAHVVATQLGHTVVVRARRQ